MGKSKVAIRIKNRKEQQKKSHDIYAEITAQKLNMKAVDIESVAKEKGRSVLVRKMKFSECECYNIIPAKEFNGEYIFYLYDSQFSYEISRQQLNYIMDIAYKTKMGVVIPIYPVSPEFSLNEAIGITIKAYRDLAITSGVDKIVLMGDGVGAGLALEIMALSWKEGLRKPDKLVLLRPILDFAFIDANLEKEIKSLQEKSIDRTRYSKGIKNYIKEFWNRDLAEKREYTSPLYEDHTDLCDDVLLISGALDVYNPQARCFYDRAGKHGVNVKYFEYEKMGYEFLFDESKKEATYAKNVIIDIITDSRDAIVRKYMYEIKRRSDWSKKFPEIFKDDVATKFIYEHKSEFSSMKAKNENSEIIMAAKQHALDEGVRKFLLMYPNGTVVHLGCGIDTMMKRVDNGRVKWFNCDTPGNIAVRRMYVKDGKREKTIDRSLNDVNWIYDLRDDKSWNRGNGLLFVCDDIFNYQDEDEVKKFVDLLYKTFQGANVLFNVSNKAARTVANMSKGEKELEYRKRKFFTNNPKETIEDWNTAYRIVFQNGILENVNLKEISGIKASTLFRMKMSKRANNNRVVLIKLGYERYQLI